MPDFFYLSIPKCTSTKAQINLRAQTLGQRGHLLLEQILGLLPHPGVLAVLQLQKAGHQGLAEHLGAFPGEERGQVVDADDAERGALGARGQDDRHGGLVEGGRDIVNGNGVVRVGTVGGNELVPD